MRTQLVANAMTFPFPDWASLSPETVSEAGFLGPREGKSIRLASAEEGTRRKRFRLRQEDAQAHREAGRFRQEKTGELTRP